MSPADNNPEFLAPRDALELQLAQIWEELLDRRPIGVNENFFELGGDSLLAMSLLVQIAQQTGYNLPVGGILQAPTIERLAATLRQESDPADWSPMVPIQSEGPKLPIFCVHPAGGNVLCYLELSRHLGKEQPFYGLQAPGIDGIREPLEQVEEMGAEYVEAVRRIQPRGPYAVAGWSAGGVVAYEMAQQLRASGEEVRLLAIIDSGILYAFAVMTTVFPKEELGLFDTLRLPAVEQLSQFRRRTAPARLIPEDAHEELAGRIYRLFVTNMRAVLSYQAKPYDGEVTVFQASEKFVRSRHQPYGEWSRLCDEVRLQMVPGNHLTLIHAPHVNQLAAKLGNCLDGKPSDN